MLKSVKHKVIKLIYYYITVGEFKNKFDICQIHKLIVLYNYYRNSQFTDADYNN